MGNKILLQGLTHNVGLAPAFGRGPLFKLPAKLAVDTYGDSLGGRGAIFPSVFRSDIIQICRTRVKELEKKKEKTLGGIPGIEGGQASRPRLHVS
jgi:hypothetical protein